MNYYDSFYISWLFSYYELNNIAINQQFKKIMTWLAVLTSI